MLLYLNLVIPFIHSFNKYLFVPEIMLLKGKLDHKNIVTSSIA